MMSLSLNKRHWMAPEVIQTSAMDCGPATLKCLLNGYHIPASYGRLREACQTSVDGTSIDVIENVAQQLGLNAEQVLLPPDHLWQGNKSPILIVVRRADTAAHFVIVWRRIGPWLQIMDPAVGRRWVTQKQLERDIYIQQLQLPTEDWFQWAIGEQCQAFIMTRLALLGANRKQARNMVRQTIEQSHWYAIATLDAAIRMVHHLYEAGAVHQGQQCFRLLQSLINKSLQEPPGRCESIPTNYWSVEPVSGDRQTQQLSVRGAILLKIDGRLTDCKLHSEAEKSTKQEKDTVPLSPELDAALREAPAQPARELWKLVRIGGLLTPLALMGAAGLAMGAIMVEALLFRGIFEIAAELNLVSQRITAFLALLMFVAMLWVVELPIISESLRLGRHLETRLRLLLMKKLPKLNDRYLQSRPVSDMAERSHSIYLLRQLPEQVAQFIRSSWELLFTLVGIALLALQSLPLAILIAGVALGLSILAHPWMSERDLRVRSHAGALQRFYLDALLGVVPIRTHSAERSVRREHENLLSEWARAALSPVRLSLLIEGVRHIACMSLAGLLLYLHIAANGISGSLLLLVYWVLKLPALGKRLADLILQYPTQRSIALRLLEPINAPEDNAGQPTDAPTKKPSKLLVNKTKSGVAIHMEQAAVIASGHMLLQNINLTINGGEHVAIVGPSGAGKSSLLGLLLGWHQNMHGQITVDGQLLNGYFVQQLRAETAWLDPAVQLWNRSLWENLRYSPNPGSHSSLGNILQQADLEEVLAHAEHGLQTKLGEGGARLSGGEGQRVRLARIFWQQNARLILLDEAFRGLDRKQRLYQLVQVRHRWPHATLLCVSHDIRETLAFPRVLVIENGQIIEDGQPKLLAKTNSRYREMLYTERSLQQRIWDNSVWRRIQLKESQLHNHQQQNSA